MSKKARRRPSWGKYRQKYGKWAVYYQSTKSIYGLEEDWYKLFDRSDDEKILEKLLNDYIYKYPL